MTEAAELGQESAALKLTSAAELQTRLADLVVQKGLVTRDRIEELQHRSKWLEEPLDRILMRENLLSEDAVLELVAQVTGIPLLQLAQIRVEEEAVKLVPPRVVAHYRIMPIRVYGGTITVATDRLGELGREDQLRLMLGCTVRWVLCKSHEISECIKHYYGVGLRSFVGLSAGEEKGRPAGRPPGWLTALTSRRSWKRSSAMAWRAAPPTSTSSRTRSGCGCATALTAC